MNANPYESIAHCIDKIALEMVFAGPGRDEGLLPINSLLSDIEALAPDLPLPDPFTTALALARKDVDAALDAGGFTSEILERLHLGCEWARIALPAIQRDQPLEPLPEPVFSAGSKSEPTPDHPLPPAAPGPDEELVLDLARDGDLLREFLAESTEHLHGIEQGVLTLEKTPADADTLHSIFRSFHTFKGGSGFLNLTPIHHLAHDLESLLDLARQGQLAISAPIINVILDGADILRRFIDEIRLQLDGVQPHAPISLPTRPLLDRINAVLARSGAPESRPAPEASRPAVQAAGSPPPPPHDPPPVPAPGRAAARSVASFVKVDTQKLDGLVDLVGEIVIAQSLVAQDPDLHSVTGERLPRHLAQLGRLTAELQRTAMSLRMVPVRATFEKMKRLVRDLALKEGKQVDLQFSGEETEVDRNLIEKLDDPLVHMIRNAVDHGIETPEARVAAGKPARGNIHLRALHRGGNILIEIRDDGAGLCRDRILAKARRLGLLPEGPAPTDDQIYSLIFAPGFSTAEKVTEISGRGVGLDVVHRNITGLRGKVEIATVPSHGCTFTILLPLTLAIIDGLIVGVGDQRFILPTLSIRESFRPAAGSVTTVLNRGEIVDVRGRQCPLLRLHRILGIPPRSEDPCQSIVVVLESDQDTRALLVDQLLGKQEVVIKSLGDTFLPSFAVAGAAILGDGRVGLILDVNRLLHPPAPAPRPARPTPAPSTIPTTSPAPAPTLATCPP